MTQLHDVIHFYLHQKFMFRGEIYELEYYDLDHIGISRKEGNTIYSEHLSLSGLSELKPMLRPLSDMTEEEKTWFVIQGGDLKGFIVGEAHFEIKHDLMKKYYFDALTNADNNEDMRLGPKFYFMAVAYLTSRGIDLFDLIESGQAVDKTKMQS